MGQVTCQHCGGAMRRHNFSEGNSKVFVGIFVALLGVIVFIVLPIIGWVLGPLLFVWALGMGGKRKQSMRCVDCGYFYEVKKGFGAFSPLLVFVGLGMLGVFGSTLFIDTDEPPASNSQAPASVARTELAPSEDVNDTVEVVIGGSGFGSAVKPSHPDLEQVTQETLQYLKDNPKLSYQDKYDLYLLLSELHPDNKAYSDSVLFYGGELRREEREIQQAVDRSEGIQRQFSPYSGAHYGLQRLIKSAMHNPDSYEHVRTSYSDEGGYLIVETTYRGTNAFGATIRGYVKAQVGLNGQIIDIIEGG